MQGISETVATVLVFSIAVGAVSTAYTIYEDTATSIQDQVDLAPNVEEISVESCYNTTNRVRLEIRNTGDETINASYLNIYTDRGKISRDNLSFYPRIVDPQKSFTVGITKVKNGSEVEIHSRESYTSIVCNMEAGGAQNSGVTVIEPDFSIFSNFGKVSEPGESVVLGDESVDTFDEISSYYWFHNESYLDDGSTTSKVFKPGFHVIELTVEDKYGENHSEVKNFTVAKPLNESGGVLQNLRTNSSIKSYTGTICIGSQCPYSEDTSTNRDSDSHVNESGDDIGGSLKTNSIISEPSMCLGNQCTSTYDTEIGWLSNASTETSGTIALENIKGIDSDLCMGDTC